MHILLCVYIFILAYISMYISLCIFFCVYIFFVYIFMHKLIKRERARAFSVIQRGTKFSPEKRIRSWGKKLDLPKGCMLTCNFED